MRRIIIAREKARFVGSLIKYLCVLNMSENEFQQYIDSNNKSLLNESIQIIPISNGESIALETSEQENELFIAAITSTGLALSNQVSIDPSSSDIMFTIKTDYSFTKGTKLSIIKTSTL